MLARKRVTDSEANIPEDRTKGYPDGDKTLNGINEPNLKGDYQNVALLFFLYLLQGIPIGLISGIPMILQNRGVSYKDQATFSFAYWPFSLKLLWAPIVDSWYHEKFGRRKTWLVPIQYLIGVFMLVLSMNVDNLLGEDTDKTHPNVTLLMLVFFVLNFLAATQDIAVDGWALTMLRRCNIGYASTCNSVGQTAGYFLGYILFIALESESFCNTWLRSVPGKGGIITFSGFLFFWGIMFFVTTTIVTLFKKERDGQASGKEKNEEPELGIKDTYMLLWKVVKMPAFRTTIIVLLTCKIGFAACDSATSLKLIDAGVPKEKLVILAMPMVPLQILLPLIISRYTAGPRPMDVFLKAFPYRLLSGLVFAAVVYVTPFMVSDNHIPLYYYGLLIVIYSLHQVGVYSMFVAVMAFFAQISDPAVGGTYMTLLNTVCNLGGNWPSTVALWFVDGLTFKSCDVPNELLIGNDCSTSAETEACLAAGGKCNIVLDGYYVESIICVAIGFIWLQWARPVIQRLQSYDESVWKVSANR